MNRIQLAFVSALSVLTALPVHAAITAPTIDTAGMDGVGTAILGALAVVAGVSLMIKMIRKA